MTSSNNPYEQTIAEKIGNNNHKIYSLAKLAEKDSRVNQLPYSVRVYVRRVTASFILFFLLIEERVINQSSIF